MVKIRQHLLRDLYYQLGIHTYLTILQISPSFWFVQLSPIENASPSTSQDDQAKNYNGQIATISSGAILNAAAKATLTTVGFKSTGIAATSIASGWQSWVGVGSVFSYLQSAGTLGWFSLGPGSLVGGVLGVVGVGNWWWNRNNDKEPAPKDN